MAKLKKKSDQIGNHLNNRVDPNSFSSEADRSKFEGISLFSYRRFMELYWRSPIPFHVYSAAICFFLHSSLVTRWENANCNLLNNIDHNHIWPHSQLFCSANFVPFIGFWFEARALFSILTTTNQPRAHQEAPKKGTPWASLIGSSCVISLFGVAVNVVS